MKPNLTDPPAEYLTPEQWERWQSLKEELVETERQIRELLLASYTNRPADHVPAERLNPTFEGIAEGLTSQEREGLLLLDRDKFIRWGELKTRAFEVIGFQHKLLAEASERFGLSDH